MTQFNAIYFKISKIQSHAFDKDISTNFVTFGWCLKAIYAKHNDKTLQKHRTKSH